MAFIRKRGKTVVRWLPVAASAGAVVKGAVMAFSGGVLVPALNDVATYSCAGVIQQAITTADTDYTTARLIPIEIPIERMVEWEAPVVGGALAATSVGAYFDFVTGDTGDGIDQNVSTLDHALCTKFISATKGWFVLNIGPDSHTKA